MALHMEEVSLEPFYGSVTRPAFDLEDPGFDAHWWDRHVHGYERSKNLFLRWSAGRREVARAHVSLDAEIGGEYVGLGSMPERVHDIPFFEVHRDFRLRQIGLQAIRQVGERLPDRILTAFSEGADGFWHSTDWVYYPRADGSALYQRLFVRMPPRLARIPSGA